MNDTFRRNEPLISILTSVFNEELYLAEMLDSLQAQTYSVWELLIVDDGSTDRSREIARSYAETDQRIRIISDGQKIGKVAAFNWAFKESSGQLVALTAGDDTMPARALESRVAAFRDVDPETPTVAYFKLRTMSLDRRVDGRLIPRRNSGSRSGPSLTMTRRLADLVFPVPEGLPSEDTWLGEATEALAIRVIDSSEIVMNYRIHDGNSNPRHRTFEAMSEAIGRRARAWELLLETQQFVLPAASKERLRQLVRVEALRRRGSVSRILLQRDMRIIDRLANASMANATLFRIRTRFYGLLTGWRGR